jgi:hypothetical protein
MAAGRFQLLIAPAAFIFSPAYTVERRSVTEQIGQMSQITMSQDLNTT